MSTQLRLVDTPAPRRKATPTARKAAPARATRARTVRGGTARRAHWASDWRIDATTRQAGRQGVAAARDALAQAARGRETLSRAS